MNETPISDEPDILPYLEDGNVALLVKMSPIELRGIFGHTKCTIRDGPNVMGVI